jgi:hypothetical protein
MADRLSVDLCKGCTSTGGAAHPVRAQEPNNKVQDPLEEAQELIDASKEPFATEKVVFVVVKPKSWHVGVYDNNTIQTFDRLHEPFLDQFQTFVREKCEIPTPHVVVYNGSTKIQTSIVALNVCGNVDVIHIANFGNVQCRAVDNAPSSDYKITVTPF